MRSIEMKRGISVSAKSGWKDYHSWGGFSVRDASAAKNRKPANLQIKPLDVEKLELNVNHWFYTSHHSNPTLNYFRQTTYIYDWNQRRHQNYEGSVNLLFIQSLEKQFSEENQVENAPLSSAHCSKVTADKNTSVVCPSLSGQHKRVNIYSY